MGAAFCRAARLRRLPGVSGDPAIGWRWIGRPLGGRRRLDMRSRRRHGQRTPQSCSWGRVEETMPSSPVEQLAGSLEDIGKLIEGVRDEQWEQPTPCVAWSVRDL